jgi:hypothetical protein
VYLLYLGKFPALIYSWQALNPASTDTGCIGLNLFDLFYFPTQAMSSQHAVVIPLAFITFLKRQISLIQKRRPSAPLADNEFTLS